MSHVLIDNGSHITRSSHVLLTRAGDEGVLVDETGGSVHVVNATAARVWELCGEGATFNSVLHAMSAEYDIDEAELRGDLEAVLSEFRELSLVSVSPGS